MWWSLTPPARRSQAIQLGVSPTRPEGLPATGCVVSLFRPRLPQNLPQFNNHFPARHRAHRGGPLTDRVSQLTKEPITATN